jgi:hypothetical protein
MRSSKTGLLLIVVTGMLAGCASSPGTKPDSQAGTQANPSADAKTCVMQSGGADMLRVTLPPTLKCVPKDGMLHLNAPQYDVFLWLVPGAQTVDDGIGRIGQVIVGEFKDFKTTRTSDLTVAGSPAKRSVGSGHEADDGDNGQADVIVFNVGSRIFIACVHGEDLTPMAEQGIMTVVQGVQAP